MAQKIKSPVGELSKNKLSQEHLEKIQEAFMMVSTPKYWRGSFQHKDKLLDKSTLDLLIEIRDEAIDAFIYAETAIMREMENFWKKNSNK